MRGTSAASLATVQAGFEPVLRAAKRNAALLGGQLFSLVDALTSSGSLRRAMSDPARSGDDKAALVRAVLGTTADKRVVHVAEEFARVRWTSADDLVDAIEEVAADAVLASAQATGRLETVEEEIFRFERVLIGQRDLRRALTDRAAPAASRSTLVGTLLRGKVEPATVQLVSRAAFAPRGRTMSAMLGRMLRLSARRRQMLVASVTAAAPLSDAQHQRLASMLEIAYGRAVKISVVVDPLVIGGMKVQVGAHVVDSTLLGRLEDVRRRLAG